MVTRNILALVMIVLLAMPAVAQTTVSLGPQIGFYKAKDADRASGLGGMSLRLKLSDAFGVEGSINYRKERYYNGYINVNSWPVMMTGLLYVAPIVYGAIGAGWYNNSIEYDIPNGYLGGPATVTSETQQEFGWHFGAGVELPVGPSVQVIGDVKYVFLDYNFTRFPGSNGVDSNFYVMTVGLLFIL